MSAVSLDIARQLAVDGLSADVFDSFSAAGVAFLVLKGPSIEQWLYRDDEVRSYGDIDVLVAPYDLARAEHALKQLGLTNRYDGPSPNWAEEHADAWGSSSHPTAVDLHRRLWGLDSDPLGVWNHLWARRTTVPVGRRTVPVLGYADRALALALHAAHHGEESPKSVEDLRRGLLGLEFDLWLGAAETARQLGGEAGLSSGLALLPQGRALRDRLGLAKADRSSIQVHPHAWTMPASADGLLRVASAAGLVGKLRVLRSELVPSKQFMQSRSAQADLAQRGTRGLALAYGLRAVNLVRSLPAALVAVRQHRHEVPRPR